MHKSDIFMKYIQLKIYIKSKKTYFIKQTNSLTFGGFSALLRIIQ